jgi:SAM-dependent methyltransferase
MNVALNFTDALSTVELPYERDSRYRIFSRATEPLDQSTVASPLLNLLQGCRDTSSSSGELLRRAIQDGFLYECTPFRASVVRALTIPPASRVLELGCVAGAVTRYLGECGHSVVGLETSVQMAACAAERCRDLANVSVFCDSLDRFAPMELFDVVVCIDPSFPACNPLDPLGSLLTRARDLLKPTGSLVLALGSPSSSMGQHFVRLGSESVRGLSAPLEPVEDLLSQVGFRKHDTLLAYPHHAAPALLVHPLASRKQGIDWSAAVPDAFDTPVGELPDVQEWWAQAVYSGEVATLAMGHVLVAHRHRVHNVLWNGWAAKRFVLEGEGSEQMVDLTSSRGVVPVMVPFSDPQLARWVEHVARPRLLSTSALTSDVEELRSRLELSLGREREASAAFTRDELVMKEELVETQLRMNVLQSELQSVRSRQQTLIAENASLLQQQESWKHRLDVLDAELRGVVLQHKALFEERELLIQQADEAQSRAATLALELDKLKVNYLLKLEENAALAKREAELTATVGILSSRNRSLEELATSVMGRAAGLDRQLKEATRTWGWRLSNRISRIFGGTKGESR